MPRVTATSKSRNAIYIFPRSDARVPMQCNFDIRPQQTRNTNRRAAAHNGHPSNSQDLSAQCTSIYIYLADEELARASSSSVQHAIVYMRCRVAHQFVWKYLQFCYCVSSQASLAGTRHRPERARSRRIVRGRRRRHGYRAGDDIGTAKR